MEKRKKPPARVTFHQPEPDDPMFNQIHIAAIRYPTEEDSMVTIRPYKHSPEEGTAEADEQPWTIHVPVQPSTDDDSADPREESEETGEDDPTS